MKIVKVISIIFLIGYSFNGYSQQLVAVKNQLKDIATYFAGKWHGEGHFASGKSIAASLQFTMPLDSAWLMSVHTDDLPNRYKAVSMWGIECDKITAELFDNFGGRRAFDTQPWDGKSMVLTRNYLRKDNAKVFERFSYTVTDAQHFNMKYELSADSLTWRLGDELKFTKIN